VLPFFIKKVPEKYMPAVHMPFSGTFELTNCQLGSRFLKPMFAEDVAAK
jgi:hypothetical protein